MTDLEYIQMRLDEGASVDLDRPMCGLWHRRQERKPPIGVCLGVGVREHFRKIPPDVAIVRIGKKRVAIRRSPVSEEARATVDLHQISQPLVT